MTTARSKLLTEDELREWLGVSERALRSWRAAGSGPPHLFLGNGRLIRYREEDVQAWISRLAASETPAA